jgi:hypothetical protein
MAGLLKQIAPGLTRAAILRDPTSPTGTGQFGAIQSVAPALAVDVSPVGVSDARQIDPAVAVFARGPNGGLIGRGARWHNRIAISSSAWRRGTNCRRSISNARSSWPAASSAAGHESDLEVQAQGSSTPAKMPITRVELLRSVADGAA